MKQKQTCFPALFAVAKQEDTTENMIFTELYVKNATPKFMDMKHREKRTMLGIGEKMTNFERIKGMSVEELAKILVQYDSEYGEYLVYGADTCCDSREKAVKSQIFWLLRGVDK